MSVTDQRTEEVIEGMEDVYAPSVDIDLRFGGPPSVSSDGRINVPQDVADYLGASMTSTEEYDATIALFSYLAVSHAHGNHDETEEFARGHDEAPNIAAMAFRAVEDAHVDAHRFGNFQGLGAKHDTLLRGYINGDSDLPDVGGLPDSEALVEGFRQLSVLGTVNGLDQASRPVRQALVWADRRLDESAGKSPAARREAAEEITDRLVDTAEDTMEAEIRAAETDVPFRDLPSMSQPITDSVANEAESLVTSAGAGLKTAGMIGLKLLLYPVAFIGYVSVLAVKRLAMFLGSSESFEDALKRLLSLFPDWLVELFDFGLFGGSKTQSSSGGRCQAGSSGGVNSRQPSAGSSGSRSVGGDDDSDGGASGGGDSDTADYIPDSVSDLTPADDDMASAATSTNRGESLAMLRRSMTQLETLDVQTDSEVANRQSDRDDRIGRHGTAGKVMNAVEERGLSDEIQRVFQSFRPAERREYAHSSGHRLNMREVSRTNAGRSQHSDQMFYRQFREASGQKSVGVTVDLSGSMDVFEAKVALAALAEATQMTGDELSATGFATGDNDALQLPLITAPGEDFDPHHLTSVEEMSLTPTADGVRDIRQLLHRSAADEKVAIVVTDGLPNIPLGGGGKDSDAGMRDAKREVEKTRNDGVSVIGIGVGDVDEEKMEQVFGEEGYVDVDTGNLAEELIEVYKKQLDDASI